MRCNIVKNTLIIIPVFIDTEAESWNMDDLKAIKIYDDGKMEVELIEEKKTA